MGSAITGRRVRQALGIMTEHRTAQRLLRKPDMMLPPPAPPHLDDLSLSLYLDGTRAFALLDAEEERRQARGLQALRLACWNVVLTESMLASRFLALIRAEHGPAAPVPIGAWVAGAPVPEALTTALLVADPDGGILERLDAALADDDGPHVRRLRDARGRYMRARNHFMCANLRLVVTVAKRYGRHHMALADRVQEGNIGLLKAIDRFDPERGFRFSTYAAWWIRHAVTRALVNHGRLVRVPAHIHTLFTKVRRARSAILHELGRDPTLVEIALRIGAPLEKVDAAVEAMELRAIGLDEPTTDEGSCSIGDVLPDEQSYDWADRIGERRDVRRVAEVIGGLDVVAHDIVVHRFGLGGVERQTLRSLGERHQLSRERVRQLQNKALLRLRQTIESIRVEPCTFV
jgi:RNA polymerase sigma factor (sigma-70 family)